ncbi:dihydrofolate reductase [Virgibacillus halophilus]|nr:dihydrofolate reductase [Virgibacillus halophilus]
MIALLLAMDRNQVIGLNGDMPWHLPKDLAFF